MGILSKFKAKKRARQYAREREEFFDKFTQKANDVGEQVGVVMDRYSRFKGTNNSSMKASYAGAIKTGTKLAGTYLKSLKNMYDSAPAHLSDNDRRGAIAALRNAASQYSGLKSYFPNLTSKKKGYAKA